jgi:hypothetical protein
MAADNGMAIKLPDFSSIDDDNENCSALYYRGKRRGERCDKKVFDKGLCERHLGCKHASAGDTPVRCKSNLRNGTQCANIGYYTSGCCPRHNYKKSQTVVDELSSNLSTLTVKGEGCGDLPKAIAETTS